MIQRFSCWVIPFLFGLSMFPSPLRAADPLFSSRIVLGVDFATGFGIPAILNGDAREDLILVSSSDTLYSLINNGAYDFTVVKGAYLGRGVSALRLGDFNLDGEADLVSTSALDDYVTVLLGNGGGLFTVVDAIDVGDSPVDIAIGNFDLDDNVDLAVVNKGDDAVMVLLGNGQGNFARGDTLQTGLEPTGIVSGDFNRDGHTDLAVSNYLSDDVSSYLGDGTGHFSPLGNYTASNGPNGISTGDIDEDSFPDLVVSNANSQAIALLLGNGDGSFRREAVIPMGADITWIHLLDIDGDGHLDYFLDRGGFLSIRWGDGAAGFEAEANLSLPATYGWQLTAGAVIDVDGDGLMDCVAFHRGVPLFSVFKAVEERAFLATTRYPLTAGPRELLSTDFNDDGFIDVVGVDRYAHSILFFPGDGSGGLGPPVLTSDIGSPSLVVAGHFDDDDHLDLAGHTDFGSDDSLWISRGVGDGTFSTPSMYYGGTSITKLAGGDFNGDGITDLVVGDAGDDRVRAYVVDVSGVPSPTTVIPLADDPSVLLTEDFDADGDDDLAVVVSGAGNDTRVRFFRGNGAGYFGDAGSRSMGGHVVEVLAGEFREDTFYDYPDMVVETRIGSWPNYTYSGVLWVNIGDFVFYESGMFVQDDEAWEMASGFLNGDPSRDVAIVQGLTFSVYTGDGLGSFAGDPFAYGFSGDATDLSVVDLDGNGVDEVLIVSYPESMLELVPSLSAPLGIRDRPPGDPTTVSPRAFFLSQNYPNPFNPSTRIEFSVPGGRDREIAVSLKIYDIRGRLVRVLVADRVKAGSYRVSWSGRDESERLLPSGVYLCRMEAGNFRATRKLLLSK